MCQYGHPDDIDREGSLLVLIINVFFPGVGTLIAACLSEKCRGSTVVCGILQLILSIVIIGWIWAIWWSVMLDKKVSKKAVPATNQQQTQHHQTQQHQPHSQPPQQQPYTVQPYVPPQQQPYVEQPYVPPPPVAQQYYATPEFKGAPPPPAPQ